MNLRLHRSDPLAARRHRRVVFGVALVLGAVAAGASLALEDVVVPTGARDVLPRRSTIALIELRPGDSSPSWVDAHLTLAVRQAVVRAFEERGATLHLDTRRQFVALAWVQTPTGVARVAGCSCPPVPGARVLAGMTFVSDDPVALESLGSPSSVLSDDPTIRAADLSLPTGEAFEAVVQPALLAAALPFAPTNDHDLDALLESAVPLAATWPTIVARGHVSHGMLAVSASVGRSPGLTNRPLSLPHDASVVHLADPDLLLVAPEALALPWTSGAPPLTYDILRSEHASVALLADGGVHVTASRPLGWSVEEPVVDQLLRWVARSRRTTEAPLPLPDGGSGVQLVGPSDGELPVTEADGWRAVGADARAYADGSVLTLLLGTVAPPSLDAPEERIARARVLDRDVPALLAAASNGSPALVALAPAAAATWRSLGVTSVELDAATTSSTTLVRLRWR